MRLEISDEPLGFVLVEPTATASQIRKLIVDSIPDAPKSFQFLCNGIVVSPQQEDAIICSQLLPVVSLRPLAIPPAKAEVNIDAMLAEVTYNNL